MKWHVLTGPPGSGKTTLRKILEQQHGIYTVPETAQDLIEHYQAKGVKEPWKLSFFQKELSELQNQRQEFSPQHVQQGVLDRSHIDMLSYAQQQWHGLLHESIKKYEYGKIFFIEKLSFLEKTNYRQETPQEAHYRGEDIRATYRQQGFDLISIPSYQQLNAQESINRRVQKILKHLQE